MSTVTVRRGFFGFVVQGLPEGDKNFSLAYQARFLAAEQAGDEGHRAWLDEAQSTCRELGRGLKGADSEVLLRSFNAG